MTKFKNILAIALLFVLGLPVSAQTDNPLVQQIAKVLKDHQAGKNTDDFVKDQVKNFVKLHKKDANAIAGLAQAYYDIKDTANAKNYAELAISKNKNCGDAYCILGDIAALQSNDGGDAAMWYQNAQTMDPTNPKGYIRYAAVYRVRSPKEAVNALENLRKVNPSYPVDAEAGNIYYNAGRFKEALENFNKVKDLDKLEKNYLFEYTGAAYFAGDYNKSLEIAEYGLKKFPNEPNFNRMGMYDNLINKNYEQAETYGKALLSSNDSVISAMDLQNMGHVYNGLKDYQKAVEYFKKSLDKDSTVNDVRQYLYKAYSDIGDIDDAISIYKEYVNHKEAKSNADLSELASIYTTTAAKTEDAAKKDRYLAEADSIWAQYIKDYPQVAEYGMYMRAKVNENRDPDYTKGTAKPYWEELEKAVLSHSEKGANDNAYLSAVYYYLGAYYYTAGKKEEGDVNWKKLLEVDPNNATAKKVLGVQ